MVKIDNFVKFKNDDVYRFVVILVEGIRKTRRTKTIDSMINYVRTVMRNGVVFDIAVGNIGQTDLMHFIRYKEVCRSNSRIVAPKRSLRNIFDTIKADETSEWDRVRKFLDSYSIYRSIQKLFPTCYLLIDYMEKVFETLEKTSDSEYITDMDATYCLIYLCLTQQIEITDNVFKQIEYGKCFIFTELLRCIRMFLNLI